MKVRANSGRSLRSKRIRADLSLRAVGQCFRSGVSKQRILQIEAARQLRQETIDAYDAAISVAIAERARLDAILKRVSDELNQQENSLQGSAGLRMSKCDGHQQKA